MTERTARKLRYDDTVRLRGGPGWHYPCDNHYMTECASWHCQRLGRCRLTEYFALFKAMKP